MSDDRARILVVDDVPEDVRLLEAVLDAHGYDTVSATDGRAALELANAADPDLVLLDVMMPELDGYTVCRTLRGHEDTAVLPVIMLILVALTNRWVIRWPLPHISAALCAGLSLYWSIREGHIFGWWTSGLPFVVFVLCIFVLITLPRRSGQINLH